jgi:hypothetical protein
MSNTEAVAGSSRSNQRTRAGAWVSPFQEPVASVGGFGAHGLQGIEAGAAPRLHHRGVALVEHQSGVTGLGNRSVGKASPESVGERTDNKAFKLTRSATSKLPRPLQLNAVFGVHLE